MSNNSIWHIDRTLSSATTPGQSGPGSNGNEEVLCISQSSSITGASPADCLVSYLEHSVVGSLISQQRYSQFIQQPLPLANWVIICLYIYINNLNSFDIRSMGGGRKWIHAFPKVISAKPELKLVQGYFMTRG